MSDITNPGLVNVADQAFKPDLKVDSLAIPLDDDVLVPVADQDIDPVTGNPLSVTFPTPAEAIVSGQAPGTPSQDFATIPGQPPLYLPFPPAPSDPRIQAQSVTAGIIAEITVGPGMSIQTNLTPAVVETYTVTSVLDADTLQPVVVPIPPLFGNFDSAQDTSPGVVTLISSSPLPGGLTSGLAVSLTSSSAPPPGPYDGITAISNVLSLDAITTFQIAVPNIATTGTTLGSFPGAFPPGLANAKWINITGSAGYDGLHALSNVVILNGSFVNTVYNTDPISAQLIVVSPIPYPVELINGQLLYLSGTYGFVTISNLVDISGSFTSAADSAFNPGVQTTFTSVGVLPAALLNKQRITISDTGGVPPAGYDGIWEVLDVTAHTFDISSSFIDIKSGNWSVHNFTITAALGSASVSWNATTFDIDVPFTSTSTGVWNVYSFDIAATYAGTEAGTWTYNPPQQIPTTRYRLYVTPSDLISFGISMLGRQITFGDTAANPDVSRNITGYTSAWIVIDKSEPSNIDDPILQSDPAPGDTFTLDTQRQGSEVITSGTGIVQDVTLLPIPAAAPPAVPYTADTFPQGQAVVAVSTGQQPGQPIITSGVQVPTAINVNVADQPPIGVGLPPNVFP